MFSYIIMKIMERYPDNYQEKIKRLNKGSLQKAKQKILDQYIEEDIKVLVLGFGTGDYLIELAKRGAEVFGIDQDWDMYNKAAQNIKDSNYNHSISIENDLVTNIDDIYKPEDFDIVIASLLFSELYKEEKLFVYEKTMQLLKQKGKFILIDEFLPDDFLSSFIYRIKRFPLKLYTYFLTLETIYPINTEIINSFKDFKNKLIKEKEISNSFLKLIIFQKQDVEAFKKTKDYYEPDKDISIKKTIIDYLMRWIPNRVEPGLRKIGNPDQHSNIYLTANYHLTVRKVEKALRGKDCYLLVAPSSGVNAWCAAAGGKLNNKSVERIYKTSKIESFSNNKEIIIPQLSGKGINKNYLEDRIDISLKYGPVSIEAIDKYLQEDKKKDKNMSTFQTKLKDRLEIFLSLNFITYLFLFIFISFINTSLLPSYTILFIFSGLILYSFYPYLRKFKTYQSLITLTLFEYFFLSIYINHLSYWWILGILFINFLLGYDLDGLLSGRIASSEAFLDKIGINRFGAFYTFNDNIYKDLKFVSKRCIGCKNCMEVCPADVLDFNQEDYLIEIKNKKDCIKCGACINNCPADALYFQ